MKKTIILLSVILLSFGANAQIGVIKIWAGDKMPSSRYIKCEGQTLSETSYRTLFKRIGYTYGYSVIVDTTIDPTMVGADGTVGGTIRRGFKVPDLRGAVPIGQGAEYFNNQIYPSVSDTIRLGTTYTTDGMIRENQIVVGSPPSQRFVGLNYIIRIR